MGSPRHADIADKRPYDIIEAEFDATFYTDRYLREELSARSDPFGHYIKKGARSGHSPNSWFDEDWYRSFYTDVRRSIEDGRYASGFHHYLTWGRREGRLPRYDLRAALEARMPGVTAPVLMKRTVELQKYMAGLDILPRVSSDPRRPPTIWFLLPTMNPDISFAGYRAVYELAAALWSAGYHVAVLCLDDCPNKEYFVWRERSATLRQAFSKIDVFDRASMVKSKIGRRDLFVAYSIWGLRIAQQLASRCDTTLPFLFAQEYEPIFYDSSAVRVLCEEAYSIPHYPLINSRFLLSYFERRKIGVFGGPTQPRELDDYAVFEHCVTRLPAQTARAMSRRTNRTLAVYARPEGHAARNLFEVVVLALQELARRGAFSAEWSFVGLGALSELPAVALGRGHELKMHQKMSEEAYHQFMSSLDIGISLMYAPHPGVVAFEFATTGALVVTNVYENRSADELRAICENILPCEASVESLVTTIEHAVERVDDFTLREQRIYRPPVRGWDAVFSRDFIAATFGAKMFGTNGAVLHRPPAFESPPEAHLVLPLVPARRRGLSASDA